MHPSVSTLAEATRLNSAGLSRVVIWLAQMRLERCDIPYVQIAPVAACHDHEAQCQNMDTGDFLLLTSPRDLNSPDVT
jgi:hypothetical protein